MVASDRSLISSPCTTLCNLYVRFLTKLLTKDKGKTSAVPMISFSLSPSKSSAVSDVCVVNKYSVHLGVLRLVTQVMKYLSLGNKNSWISQL